ncbi:hypothetical protein JL720_6088 [Aureococcus anophagefferens]|nr:hypothetical protein JL720_6088 [Aureococcus anophagefferens]
MATFESATATFDVCTLSPKRELIADAAGALALVETMPAALRGVKLGNKSYTAAAAAALAGRLKGLRGLVDVDIADVIAGRPEAEALEKGLDALLPLFGGTPLVSLKTCNNGMSEAAAKQLAGLLTDGGDTALERFHYHNNMSGDNGAVAVASIVAASPKLVDLRFSGTRAGRAGSLAFAGALRPRHLVHTLDLADNSFGDDGGEAIAAWLADSAAASPSAAAPLKKLVLRDCLRDCSLGDDGFAPLMEPLTCCPDLVHLDLSGNELTAASCAGGWLAGCAPALEFLGFEENELTSAGGAALALGLPALPKLATALLATNELASRARSSSSPRSWPRRPRSGSSSSTATRSTTPRSKLGELLGDRDILGDMDDNDGTRRRRLPRRRRPQRRRGAGAVGI